MKKNEIIRDFIRAFATPVEISGAPWIDALEKKTGLKFPPSFSALVRGHSFQPFTAGGIDLYGNSGADREDDICVALFNDRALSGALLANGFLQIGRPDSGSYDPVCFDTKVKSHNREYRIVRLDHEQLLMAGRAEIVAVIAPSFLAFIDECTKQSTSIDD